MTKKDYDIIAACIGAAQAASPTVGNSYRINGRRDGIDDLSSRLVLELKLDNPRFNEAHFWERVEYWRASHANT